MSLRSLRLSGNEFGEAGERALVEVLEQGNHSLDALLLEDKPILQKYVDFLPASLRKKERRQVCYFSIQQNEMDRTVG
jgi:hypothetical protein